MAHGCQIRNLVSILFNKTKNIFLCFLALFLRSKSQCGYKSNINVNVVALAQVPLPDALTFSIFGEYRSSL